VDKLIHAALARVLCWRMEHEPMRGGFDELDDQMRCQARIRHRNIAPC
jgi:hypothetical protein